MSEDMYDPARASNLPPSYRLRKLDPTPEEVREAMQQVIGEFWEAERRDFDENPDPAHPYCALRVLHTHLYGGGER